MPPHCGTTLRTGALTVSNWVDYLPLLLLVVIFWLLIVRPARARQRAFLQTQSELSSGDKVMLASGIFGEIAGITDDTVQLRIAPNTVIEVKRQAIASVERSTPDGVASDPSDSSTPDTGSADH
jgi:preprotein translocase subunit YajC